MDPVAAARLDGGLALPADEYVRMLALRRKAEQAMNARSRGIDAWITPTLPVLPHPIADYRTVEDAAAVRAPPPEDRTPDPRSARSAEGTYLKRR